MTPPLDDPSCQIARKVLFCSQRTPRGSFKNHDMNVFQSITEYFRTSKSELEKVSWPSRQDTIRYSTLVVVASVVAAGFFAALDLGLSKTVEAVLTTRTGTAATAPANPSTQPTPDQPFNVVPTVEGTDANGKPADLKVTPLPLDTKPTP